MILYWRFTAVLTKRRIGLSYKPMTEEVTNKDILEAIGVFSNKVEGRFNGVEERFGGIENKLDNMATKDDVASPEQHLSIIQTKPDRALYTEPVAL
jgi:hypothetical protein